MEEEGKVLTGRQPRLKSPRKLKREGERKHPKASQHFKNLWADPVWREKQLIALQRGVQTRKERGQQTRLGVPDGMRKEEAGRLWAIAREKARKTMEALKKTDALSDLDPRSEEALETALTVMRSPQSQQTCLAAARLVLDFTKSKPVAKSELTINKAEQWLKEVAGDVDGTYPEEGEEEAT